MKKYYHLSAFLISFCLNAHAEDAKYKITQIGGTYIESPPIKDENIVAPGTFGNGEKVEAHAIIGFKNRLIVSDTLIDQESKIIATSLKPNKERNNIGPANFSRIFSTSEDKKNGVFLINISRLPEGKLTGVVFSGSIPVLTAKSLKKFTYSKEIKVGKTINLGSLAIQIFKIEDNKITFKSNTSIIGISSATIINKNGLKIKTESSSVMKESSSKGFTTISEWQFPQPINNMEKLELEVFQDIQAIDVPLSLMVMRPFN